jgi:hypothetical protein
MLRYISSLLLIGIGVAVILLFTNPLYQSIGELKSKQTIYNDALGNSKALENERDKLTAKYSTINPANIVKIKKLLPDSVDNIRLILEIEALAAPYGMAVRDVKYSVAPKDTTEESSSGGVISGGSDRGQSKNQNYGSWDLEFSVTSSYNNFLNFTKDLENNLRVVDIVSIDFTSASNMGNSASSSEIYRFSYKIKTYWLKN